MVFNVIINKQEIVNKAKMSILSLILKEQSVIFLKSALLAVKEVTLKTNQRHLLLALSLKEITLIPKI